MKRARYLTKLNLEINQHNNKKGIKSVAGIYFTRNGIDSQGIFRFGRSFDESVYIA